MAYCVRGCIVMQISAIFLKKIFIMWETNIWNIKYRLFFSSLMLNLYPLNRAGWIHCPLFLYVGIIKDGDIYVYKLNIMLLT